MGPLQTWITRLVRLAFWSPSDATACETLKSPRRPKLSPAARMWLSGENVWEKIVAWCCIRSCLMSSEDNIATDTKTLLTKGNPEANTDDHFQKLERRGKKETTPKLNENNDSLMQLQKKVALDRPFTVTMETQLRKVTTTNSHTISQAKGPLNWYSCRWKWKRKKLSFFFTTP